MNLIEAIAIGLVLGFFFYEYFGLSAGGLVVPGYIALQMGTPVILAGTVAISFVVWLTARFVSRHAIVYGRRRFILMVLIGFAWQWGFRMFVLPAGAVADDSAAIGFIIPGLIANEMERQNVLPTLAALLIISVMVRLCLIALGMLRW